MDIIEQARELGRQIQKDDRYLKVQIAQQNSDNDKELQSLIGEFNLKRMNINTEAQKEDRSEENEEQMSFSNVIIQRVGYEYTNNSKIMPVMQSVGKGNADIFIGGRYIPGYWVRESIESPTVFLDDKGNEIQLTPGKTFIAHFPPESLLTYSASAAQ